MDKKAVFLDRDGILNHLIDDRPPWQINEINIFEEANSIISLIKLRNFIPIVVTNQPDPLRGSANIDLVLKINNIICKKLGIDIFYMCTHPYDGMCDCRKPKPGMLKKAEKEYLIKLNKSILIGDRLKDIQAGNSVGCKTILLSNNKNLSADYHVFNHKSLEDLLHILL